MNFIDIRESAFMAIDTVRSNKLRSSLTILGVSVGVITVVFMVSIIQGLNKAFAAQIESLGSNTIWATKFDPSIGHQPTSERFITRATIEDADAIRRGRLRSWASRRSTARSTRPFGMVTSRAIRPF
jgi:putative ABC transport system permease protein